MTEENNQEMNDDARGSTESSPENGSPSSDSGADFEAFESDFGEESNLVRLQGDLEKVQDDLARARAEVFNVRQEYGAYVRRSKEEAGKRKAEAQEDVVEILLPVLDDIEAARAAGELASGPFASIADKLEDILDSQFGLEQFGVAGDPFDPMLHDALMANTNPDVETPVISQVLQPGFKVGDRVLRPTKVIVDNPA